MALGGWGEPAVPEQHDNHGGHGGRVDLGNGNYMEIDQEALKALLKSQPVVDAVTARTKAITDQANSLVAMDPRAVARLDDGNPAYKMDVKKRGKTQEVSGHVYPGNILGAVDNHHNLTLLKSLEAYPSDPIPNGDSK